MEWIKTVLPLLGVVIGWVLSERGKIFADKRQDIRKLKKLLFFLLELRFHFSEELSQEIEIDKCIEYIRRKMMKKFNIDGSDEEFNTGLNAWKPFIKEVNDKFKPNDDKFKYLLENIDKILIDLAEIFPILAYELNGQHNIKERLSNADNYLGHFDSINEQIPFDIKKWVNPKLTQDLINNLDDSIYRIAKQIDIKTLKSTKKKIQLMEYNILDTKKIEILIDDYFEKISESLAPI